VKNSGNKRQLVLHPIFFAVFPIIFLFNNNRSGSLAFRQVLIPLFIALAASLLLWGLLNLAYRNPRKSGLIGSLVVLLFFSFGHFHTALVGITVAGLRVWQYRYLLSAYVIIMIIAVFWTVKTSRKLEKLTTVLNLVAVFLVALSFFNIAVYSIRGATTIRMLGKTERKNFLETAPRDDYPDIYYIVTDAYAHAHTLRMAYNYDNSDFINFLEKKGFYVAAESFSNYVFTALSLPSSLNYEYLDYLWDGGEDSSEIWSALNYLIENNKVVRFLKNRDYKFVHFDSGWSINERNRHADLHLRYGYTNEFAVVLAQTTLLLPFRRALNLFAADHRKRILGIFAGIAEVQQKVPGPKFVFAHVVCPRGPFVFGPAGEERNLDWGILSPEGRRQAYADQVAFVNLKLIELLKVLIPSSDRPPIVIIQADHGHIPVEDLTGEPTDRYLRERLRILNAYFLPYGGEEMLYPSISPVNTFRLIFNYYFGTDFPLLPDRCYYNASGYDFVDVTDRVVFPPEGD